MKWQKTHRKGTKQTVIMHTNSGFTPSFSFMQRYFEYQKVQKDKSEAFLSPEEYYKSRLR